MGEKTQHLYSFGPFRLDPKECLLILDGTPVPLPPKAFEALLFLVENAGHLVDKDELMRRLWPDTFVEDGNVAKHVSLLRKILSEATNGREYIETIPKRGYRFVAEVKDLADLAASSQHPAESGASLIGKKISHYRVLQVLGGGGMGVVYKAEDLKLGRPVALKFLPEELASDAVALKRFEQEARAASALNHPNICTIYAVEEHEGTPFIAMELLEGRTLRELIAEQQASAENKSKQGHIQLGTLLDIGIQVAEGLDAAHKKGIIHRDVKPANIFLASQGQVKILDFGLAKLQKSEARDSQPEPLVESRQASNPVLTLTRTGTTVGTAAYMSPEQVRGEKLDARTDLFSFGLVLYEMAAGKRAFTGETAPVLREAIVSREPTAVHELNPQVPASLERIVNHAIEKDLAMRYQSAAEMRVDLQKEAEAVRGRNKRGGKWWILAAAGFVVLVVLGIAWMLSQRQPATSREPTFRQLTINSFENPVTSGAISPNGRYLAYTDSGGIHLKDLETGMIQPVAPPTGIDTKSVSWEVISGGWFPDSTRFVANSRPSWETAFPGPSSTSDIWAFSRSGEEPRRLREHATAWGVSRDGNLIAFGTNHGGFGEREIWLMDSNGEHDRRLVATDENHSEEGFYWSPDGQRGITVATNDSGQTIQTRDIQGGPPVTLLPPTQTTEIIGDFSWLPGRWIYEMIDSGKAYQSVENSCNFWTAKLDPAGKPLEKPKQLTHWTGFCYWTANATADGQKLAFLRQSGDHATAYIADLDPSGRIANPRHFTPRQDDEGISAWASDSKTVFINVYNGDYEGFYKQSLDSDTLQPIAPRISGGTVTEAGLSPDGKWILVLLWRSDLASNGARASAPQPLLRVPITGGTPEVVFQAARLSPFSCARPPSNLCVIPHQTEDHKQMVVQAFDAVKGLGSELLRVDLDRDVDLQQENLIASISPDGKRLAVTRGPDGPIEIHSLIGAPTQVIHVDGLQRLWVVTWSPNGKVLYVSQRTKDRNEVLALDMEGHKQLIWQNVGWTPFVVPSPDGRHLAINDFRRDANMWMMENF